MDPLDLFRPNKVVKRVYLQPPTSQKYVPQNMDAIDRELELDNPKEVFEGNSYAEEYVKEEERRILEEANAKGLPNGDNKFDEVSLGTLPPLKELEQEELIKIYKTYNFAYRPKENLTISSPAIREKIVSMIGTNTVVVIQGPTGCGKTTQVPQFILDNSFRKKIPCNIIITQPRRIAAISIAQRVSKERTWPLGTLVGYQVGMCNATSNDTRLTYCTTGVLLRKLIRSKNMLDFTHVILDEVHERSQEMDFLLLIVRKLLRSNSRQVKVILMSATFDVEKFATYFSSPMGNVFVKAPIVDVTKRNRFNVNIYYLCQMGMISQLPEVSEAEPKILTDMMNFCVKIIIILDTVDKTSEDDELCEFEEEEDEDAAEGDVEDYKRHVILVFLPGIFEIEEMHDLLKAPVHENMKWDLVVMHSSITSEEQQRIFQKPARGYRRIILSTNISESSITVPDVKYVIDFCLTKQLVTNPSSNFQSLELAWASKANCDQRAGRTGRVMDGRVYRLVPKIFYERCLPKEGDPEMLRAPLENLVLNAKILDMGEPKSLLALSLDPPDLSNLKRTIMILKEAGALYNSPDNFSDYDGELSDLGRIMASLPMDIRISKLIALGHVYSILKDSIIIGASMAVKTMFSNPFQKKLQAYNAKITWADTSCSDCIASLNVYKVWQQEKASRQITSAATEKIWAQRHYVQIRILREIDYFAKEVSKRLENLGIVESVGEARVVWTDTERAFIQKIIIAGAFYPNYFVKSIKDRESAGKESLKMVSGMDPAKTVYLQGWPVNQPGLLYAKRIQDIFRECTPSSVGKVFVSFDQSSRIYVHFWSKDRNIKQAPDVTGKISVAVYRAVKLRKIKTAINVKVLDEQSAIIAAKKLDLINDKSKTFFDEKPTFFQQKKNSVVRPVLPGLDITMIPLKITEILDPGHFWAQMIDEDSTRKLDRILKRVNTQEGFLVKLNSLPEIETLVFAPLSDEDQCFHRAMIQSYSMEKDSKVADLLYVDCGKTSTVKIQDLRLLRSFDENEKYLVDDFDLPALAFECVLANVRPTFMSNITGQWSPNARKEFVRLLKSDDPRKPKYIFGEVYSVVNSVVSLTLLCKQGMNENSKPINVNEHLVEKRFAEPKEEDYLSRANHELRLNYTDMATSQRAFYEEAQYDPYYSSEIYPEPPNENDCGRTVMLRGPFSPLEIELMHLTCAGAAKRVNIEGISVNSVLLDTTPEDPHDRLLVAGYVSESPSGSNLTLRDTTLMPNVPGLTAIVSLLFTSQMELRRCSAKSYYVGALCGLGSHPQTRVSMFPEHDMEIKFDVKIDEHDLLLINKLRHWTNVCLIADPEQSEDNMSQTISFQRRVREVILELMYKKRASQAPESVYKFNKWNLYPDIEFMKPGKLALMTRCIYPLHSALEIIEESDEIKEMRMNQLELLELARMDVKNQRRIDTKCLLCSEEIFGINELRIHLFSQKHREALQRSRIE